MKKGLSQQSILSILDNLKINLNENNSINISNLYSLNANFQFIYKYAKEGFRILTETIQKQKNIIIQMTTIIQKYGLENHIHHLNINQEQNPRIIEINENIDNLLSSRSDKWNPKEHLQPDMQNYKLCKPKLTPKYVPKINQQYRLAAQYINLYLRNMLEYDLEKDVQIKKTTILNTFLNWCEKNNYEINPPQYSIIQMALSNEIRKHFPLSYQTFRSFKGINFKPQYFYNNTQEQKNQQIQES